MRFRALSAALLLLSSGPALAWDPARAPGYASPPMYRPEVDSVIVHGTESIGQIPKMSAAATGAAAAQSLGGWFSSVVLGTPTVSTLRSYNRLFVAPGTILYASGYYAPGDAGGGMFRWANTSTAPDDGVLTFNPTGNTGAGRWLRIVSGPLRIEMAGAKCDVGITYPPTDDAPAIRASLTAARSLPSSDVIVPAKKCAIASTVGNSIWSNVRLIAESGGTGAGPGMQIQYMQDASVLQWTGAAGGTMIDWQSTDTALCPAVGNANCAFTTSSAIDGIVLDGGNLAATALRIRGLYRSHTRIKIRSVTSVGVDMDVNSTIPAGTGGGDVQQNNFDIHEDLTSTASVNAKAVLIGNGTSYQNVHHNDFNLYTVTQAGTAFEVGNADSNIIKGQFDRAGQGTVGVAFGLGVIGPGIPPNTTVVSWDASTITLSANAASTGRIEARFASTGVYMEANTTAGSAVLTNVRTGWSVDFKASPINGFGPGQVTQSARGNLVTVLQATAGVVSRQGYAGVQQQYVLAAYNNRILNWTAESTGINARIEAYSQPFGSTLSWCTESGGCTNGTRFETSNDGAFLLAGLDSPRAGVQFPAKKNFASLAEFGTDRPLYITGPNPGITYNLAYTFGGYTFGPGSSASYGALQTFDTTTGRLSLITSLPGNAGAVATGLNETFSSGAGGNRLGPTLASDPTCTFDGQTYFNSALKKLRYCVMPNTWANVGQ